MNIQETIYTAVRQMSDATRDLQDNTDAAFTVVSVDSRTQLAVAGRPEDIVIALAEAMTNAPQLKDFVIEALSIVELSAVVNEDEPCNCPDCKVNRAEANKVRPDVN